MDVTRIYEIAKRLFFLIYVIECILCGWECIMRYSTNRDYVRSCILLIFQEKLHHLLSCFTKFDLLYLLSEDTHVQTIMIGT